MDYTRKTSAQGVEFIKMFEGFSAVPYNDSADLPTIGFGHLIKPGEVFGAISSVEATALLARDLETAERAVNVAVQGTLTQSEFDALVCFTYNLGKGNLDSSTLLKKINGMAPIVEIGTEWGKWVNAGGVAVKGLKARRLAEFTLYESGDYVLAEHVYRQNQK